jgi:hypothetical protein
LERFVTNVDLKNRAFNSELKLEAAKLVKQGGGFKAYLETQGYFDYLKKNGVAEDKYGEYLVGERFKKTYVDFMLKQVYRASMKKNVIDAVLATVIFDPAQHTMSEEMKAAYNAYLQLNPKGDLESFAEYYLDQLWQDNSAAIIKDLEKQLLQPDVHFRIGGLIEEEKAGFMKYLAGKYPRYTAGEPAMVDVSANRVPRMVPLKSVITPEMAYLLITGQLTLKKKP